MSSQAWSLDKWAAQHAPLDENQRASAARLTAWQSRRPSVWHQQPLASGSSPAPLLERGPEQDRPTGEEAVDPKASPSALSLPDKADSMAALSHWLDALRDEETSAREAQLSTSLQTVTDALQWAEGVLSTASSAETHVQTLSTLSTHVRTSTTPIRASSSAAVEALDRLTALAQDIEERKTYFDVLTPVTRLLSAPSPDLALVASPEFHETWDQIDGGLRFTMAHPTYAEAARYHALFQHSAVRAASLTRMWLARYAAHWTERSAQALSRGGNEKKEILESPLVLDALFGPEGTEAPLVRSLFQQLEARARAPTDPDEGEEKVSVPEIRPILIECRDIIYSSREGLLSPVVTTLLSDVAAASLASSNGRRDSDQRSTPIWSILASATEVMDKEAVACSALLDTTSVSFGKESALTAYSTHLGRTFSSPVERATKQALESLVPPGQTSAEDVVRALTPLLRNLLQRAKALATDKPEYVAHAYRPALEQVRAVLLRAIEGKVRAIAAYSPKPGDLAYPDRITRTRAAQTHSPALQSKEDDSLAPPSSTHHRGASIGGAGVLDAAALADKAESGLAPPDAEESGLFLLPPGEAGETLVGEVKGTWYAPFKSGFLLLSRTWDVLDDKSLVQVGGTISTGVLQALKAGAGALASTKAAKADAETKGRDGVALGDATLFLLRHVLLLRETVASVHVASDRARSDPLARLMDPAPLQGEEEAPAPAPSIDLASVVGTLHSLWSGSFWRSPASEDKGKDKQKEEAAAPPLANAPLESELQSITARLVDRTCAPLAALLAEGKDDGANALAEESLSQASVQLRQYLDDDTACRTLLAVAAKEMQRLWAASHAEPLTLSA